MIKDSLHDEDIAFILNNLPEEIVNRVEEIKFKGQLLTQIPSGLEKFTNLSSLNLSDNKIQKVEHLTCNSLRFLTLRNNRISSLQGLDNVYAFSLDLSMNDLTSLQGIELMPQRFLYDLDIRDNKIKDLSPLWER